MVIVLSNELFISLKKDYTEEFSPFIRTEKYRWGVLTSTRIQPNCRKQKISIGCFDGTKHNPRNITQRITSLFIVINQFCIIWKSNGIPFNQVKRDELKQAFKVVDIVISDKHIERFF